MKDLLLDKMCETDRWQAAIKKGLGKGINKMVMRHLCDEKTRVKIYMLIKQGKYEISPPHTAKIPKDTPGEFRTVYVNEAEDRVLLSLTNDLLFELTPDMIHPSCQSYQKGKSCGSIVEKVSRQMTKRNGIVGWKSDLSKYFDSVPIEYVDNAFDAIEKKFGKSKLIDVVRAYYHSNYYFNENDELEEKYQSLKQGCAVAAWLADVILYHIDEILCKMAKSVGGLYVRYSDDMLYIGTNYKEAMQFLADSLQAMSMKLNPKKVEYIDNQHWFKFLGYSIKGEMISLSSTAIKRFQKEIENATIKKRKTTYDGALHAVYRVVYKGYQDYSWATRVLRTINVQEDIDQLNGFVMDCLRAVQTNRKKIGGLGYKREQKNGCIARGTGRNVKANREKIPELKGYFTIRCMANDLKTSRALFDSIVRML